jgi:hypothetical protein
VQIATLQIQAATVNKPATGREVDWKMEKLPGINYIQ